LPQPRLAVNSVAAQDHGDNQNRETAPNLLRHALVRDYRARTLLLHS